MYVNARRLMLIAFSALVVLLGVTAPPTGAVAAVDPFRSQQWALDVVGAPASPANARGSGIVVAVVDTGVDLNHEDLQGQVIAGHDFVDGDEVPQDENGHGTHVAGIIAGIAGNGKGIEGVAPSTKILAVRVLAADGSGNGNDVNAAVRWSADHGADVINLSLGDFGRALAGPLLDGAFTDAVNYAWSKGSIPVIAAGNESFFSSGYGSENALVVTATDRNDRLASYASSVGSAQWGLAAPGGDGTGDAAGGILSSYFKAGAPNSYAVMSGTSMAAPHVAGAVAALRSMGKSRDDAVALVLSTTKDIGAGGRDSTYGAGRLDVAAAVRAAGPPQTGTTAAPATTKPKPAPAAVAPTTRVPTAPTPSAPTATTSNAPNASAPSTIGLPTPAITTPPGPVTAPTEVALSPPSTSEGRVPWTMFAAVIWLAAGAVLASVAFHRRELT